MKHILLLCAAFCFVSVQAQDYIRFKENGKIGYKDSYYNGNVKVPAIYDDGDPFPNSRPYFAVKDAKGWFFINRNGEAVTAGRYEEVFPYTTDYPMRFKQNGLYGLMDSKFNVLVKPQYVYIGIFSNNEDFAKVIRGTCGDMLGGTGCEEALIDKQGNILANAWYDKVWKMVEDLCVVTKDGKSGTINSSGKIVLPLVYDRLDWRYYEGAIWAQTGSCFTGDCKVGFLTASGLVVVPFNYSGAKHFSKGLAPVKEGNKWGYIDKMGKWVIQPKYKDAEPHGELGAVVQIGDKYGAIDAKGNVLIPFKYSYLSEQSGALHYWSGKLDGQFVYLNPAGELFDPFKF